MCLVCIFGGGDSQDRTEEVAAMTGGLLACWLQ